MTREQQFAVLDALELALDALDDKSTQVPGDKYEQAIALLHAEIFTPLEIATRPTRN
jgi:hypothetical protein